ncbi:unnamed protein product [Mytilus coruscus]|uniref:Uncharacterized protein n=1 Tax=Mytilus coruscus TaxID=42192 RepID=A0A6J8BPN3_MYTCO|nr:unnamed protein product [Mytilus coruscus]
MVVVQSDTVNTVQSLPRLSYNTSTKKAQLKRRLRHKHFVYSSNIRPEKVREGAKFLSQTGTLYKSFNVKYNLNWTESFDEISEEDQTTHYNDAPGETTEDTTVNIENVNVDSEDEWEEDKNDENIAGSTYTLLTPLDFFETNEKDLVYGH